MAPPDAQARNLVSSDSLLASRLAHPGTNAGQRRVQFPRLFSTLRPYDGGQNCRHGLNGRHPELGILASLPCTFPLLRRGELWNTPFCETWNSFLLSAGPTLRVHKALQSFTTGFVPWRMPSLLAVPRYHAHHPCSALWPAQFLPNRAAFPVCSDAKVIPNALCTGRPFPDLLGEGTGDHVWFHCTLNILTVLLLLLSRFSRSCPTLCDPRDGSPPATPSLGLSRQEHWSGLPFPSPMHESEKWKWSHSVVSDPQRPHGQKPTRLPRPWDFPGKSTGVGCHCLLHLDCIKP